MIRNYGPRYGYYPRGVDISKKYTFLNTLQDADSPPPGVSLGSEVNRIFDSNLSTEGIFEKSHYDTGLEILKFAIENERQKEIAVLSELNNKYKLKVPSDLTSNPDQAHKFYKEMLKILDDIWYQDKELKQSLINFPGKDYRKAERTTQTLYELLSQQLYQVISGSTFQTQIKREMVDKISAGMRGKFSEVEEAIVRAMALMLNDSNAQASLIKMINSSDEKDILALNEIIRAIKKPSGQGALEDSNNTLKQKITRKIQDTQVIKKGSRKITKNTINNAISVKGLGMEAYDIFISSLIQNIKLVLSTGSSQRKADSILALGTINIDIEKMVRDLYSERERMAETRKMQDIYSFAETTQKQYELMAKQLKSDLDRLFIIHTSTKDYLEASLHKGGGFSTGGGMSLVNFANFMTGIGYRDREFLIFALNNLSTEAIGGRNKDLLSNFLAQFIAMFAFDDGLTIYSQELQNKTRHLSGVHLFLLNGRRIPLSFLLQEVYNNMREGIQQLTNDKMLRSFVNVKINAPTGYKKILNDLTENEIFGPPRWRTVSEYSMAKTQIKMSFLRNFNQIMEEMKQ